MHPASVNVSVESCVKHGGAWLGTQDIQSLIGGVVPIEASPDGAKRGVNWV